MIGQYQNSTLVPSEVQTLDLATMDLPHAGSNLEWWYVNTHIRTVDNRNLSLFASFFKLFIGEEKREQDDFAYSVAWALSDLDTKTYYPCSLIDSRSPHILKTKLDRGEGHVDPRLQRALREVLDKNSVPLPDRLLERPVVMANDKLHIEMDGNAIHRLEDGSYRLLLNSEPLGVKAEIVLKPQRAPALHGDNGVVRGPNGEDMFYYFIPDCRVEGQVTWDGVSSGIAEGSGWYDHEFRVKLSDTARPTTEETSTGWDWISVQLDNGIQLSAYNLFNVEDGMANVGSFLVAALPDGSQRTLNDFTFVPQDFWTSMKTFNRYPLSWIVRSEELRLEITARASFPGQEFVTLISDPGFWEGRVDIAGTLNGQAVTGRGYIERSGYYSVQTMSGFLNDVGSETRQAISELLPFHPDAEALIRLVGSPDTPSYIEGVNTEQFSRTLVDPIREIVDRSGKAWRSYALLSCIELAGGDSQPYRDWLAVPELLHVGSLIVDDVQDRSEVRRGGPACHHLYGEALSINAGNACYFIGQTLIHSTDPALLPPEDKLKVYDLYFTSMRAAHTGQALDIDGQHALLARVLEADSDASIVEERVRAVHKLKSAVPASTLAKMGAILGRGTEEQQCVLGHYFEALGIAFQIVDDVLNLRGFEKDLKSKGEDLTHGKVTYPVAKALTMLSGAERVRLIHILEARTDDVDLLSEAIGMLEQHGVLDECVRTAHELVETAWQELDALFADSQTKMMLRAFSWYVLERHY